MILKTLTTATCPQGMLDLFLEATTAVEGHLGLNYALEKLVDPEILCYSLTTLDDKPACASVAYARAFYNGAVRVATKYYVSKKQMKNVGLLPDQFYKNGIRTYLADQIDQQIDFCKKIGYESFFVSRDHPSFDRPHARKLQRKITSRIYNGIESTSKYKGWVFFKDLKLTCPDPASPHCWQCVIWLGRYTLNDV